MSLRRLFVVFLQAGLAFGGGLGILAVLEEQLVRRHRAIGEREFTALYGIGRIVPSGTMTALAVAFGHRLGGLPGTVLALLGLTLPAFVLTVLLTAGYSAVRDGPLLDLLPVTVLPAALALVLAAALRLGRRYAHPSPGLVIAVAAFGASVGLGLNPAVLLLVGGGASVVLARLRRDGTDAQVAEPGA